MPIKLFNRNVCHALRSRVRAIHAETIFISIDNQAFALVLSLDKQGLLLIWGRVFRIQFLLFSYFSNLSL